MLNVENVLLHFLLIVLPVFLYHGFFGSLNYFPNNRQNQFRKFLLLSISAILSMVFPLASIGQISYDFRSLIIIFTFLYLGRNYAFLLILVTSTFRFLLGGESLLLSFIFLPFFYTVPFIFSFLWNKFSKRQKYLCAVLIGTANVAVFYLILFIFQAKVGDHGFIPDNSIPSFLLGGLLYVAILFIIIFYEEYMEENTLMRIQILNSEKMNVVSELAASVAHEVRNPLTVVKGFIQLIVKDDKSANQDYMKLVLSELSRAESIISDFLNLARKNTERRETFLISSLVKDVMNVMKSYSNMNGVNLFFSLEADGELHGDINKLKQVFYNLIKNAVESINHPGGEVSILVLKKGEDAVIEIIDNGIGMSQSQLEKIGEPFYTRKETGTGLGVMVTKSIIESHNGSITYESSPGEGTKAIITLPFHKSETN